MQESLAKELGEGENYFFGKSVYREGRYNLFVYKDKDKKIVDKAIFFNINYDGYLRIDEDGKISKLKYESFEELRSKYGLLREKTQP